VDRWVDSVAALGADHIKVRNWPAPELGRALVERARLRALPVFAHGNEPFPRQGVTTLEHGIWPPLRGSAESRDSLWKTLAISGTALVPTLVTWPIRLDSPDTAIAKLERGGVPGLEYVPAKTRAQWRDQFLQLKQERPMDWTAIAAGEMRNVGEMHRAGIELLAGSDIGAPLLVPGLSLHDELELLVSRAGLTPLQALRAATLGPARVVGVDRDLGTVQPGKLADLVILDANPLLDIRATRRIHAVVARGQLLDRRRLDQLLGGAREAAK
ncbi:MAG: amidohydrolase family protein, partial [Gemmatimonadetes bacterium]|nr:amidohydrolase family protein [Gemmatimonadota bacterium]